MMSFSFVSRLPFINIEARRCFVISVTPSVAFRIALVCNRNSADDFWGSACGTGGKVNQGKPPASLSILFLVYFALCLFFFVKFNKIRVELLSD